MLRKFVFFSLFVPAISWLVLGHFSAPTRAEEPIEPFLEALTDRGYTDVAIKYLDRMANSSLAPDNFKEEVGLRKGMLLVETARLTKNTALRQSQLDTAQRALNAFLKDNPSHPSTASARNQLGNILVERARSLATRAENDSSPARKGLAKQAFDVYQDAYQALSDSKSEMGEQYRALVTARDPETKPQVKKIKAQYIQTYLAIGRVLLEQAKTVEDNEKLYKKKLTEAAKAFEEVATKYRSFSAGLYATLFEGECYQLLGEDKRALTYFKELLQSKDNSGAVRRLKTTALSRSIDSWLKTDPKNGPDRSIQLSEEWIKTKRTGEERAPAWKEFRLALAKAQLAKSKIAEGDKQAERALREAREIARDLSKRKSSVQKEAQQMLVAMGKGGEAPVVIANPDQANTFAEARDAAKAALDAMKLSRTTVSILSSQLRQVRNPERRSEIEAKLEEAKTEVATQSSATLALFEKAESLATDDDANDLHNVRYYLAFLYYTLEDYRRAAIVASHTALNYPDSVAAKECANVALAARQRLYQQLPAEERGIQMQGIAKIGELIVSKWPGDAKADSALTTLLDVAIAQGDVDQAEKYLTRIPATSPKRAAAELRFGQKLWREYLNSVLQKKDGDIRMTAAPGSDLKARALEMLQQGMARSEGQQPTESAIRGALSLAKIYVDSGKTKDALELLQREGIGAIYLADSQSPWLKKVPGLSTDGYTTAIRANIASAATSGDSQASIAAAQRMLRALRDDLMGQPDGKKRMISIYVGLARDLEQQLSVASPESQASLSRGFESFLKQAAEGSDDVAVLNWVAETMYGMGNGLLQGTKSSPEAQRYFTEAAKQYDQVLSIAEKNPDALPAETVQQIRVRQAMTFRQIGKFQKSMDLFADVLAKKRFLNIQVEAAKTLQQWGAVKDDAYTKAIMGDRPAANGKNLIWGWGRIAKLVAREEKHRDTFYDARYNIAYCRYKLAGKKSGAQKKTLLSQAKSDLTATQKLYGLNSSAQIKRFESLLKAIQKSLGEPEIGFAKK